MTQQISAIKNSQIFVQGPFQQFSNRPHIIDLMLQHLSFMDVMRMTQVSTFNHDFIFCWPACVKKMKLVVNRNGDRTDLIIESARRYHYIKIDINSDSTCSLSSKSTTKKQLAVVISKNNLWKGVELWLYDGDFEVLGLCQNIEELTIKSFSIDFGTFGRYTRSLKFKNLKSLKIQNADNLITLDIIKRSPILKSLTLNGIFLCQLLLSDLAKLPPTSAIEELHISESSSYNFEQNKMELGGFITVHLNTIKKIVFDVWAGLPVIKILFTMSNLRELELYELAKCNETTDWEAESLPKNRSINRLWLEDLKSNKLLLKCFLKSTPNVTDLKVHLLDEEILEIIRAYTPNVIRPATDFP